MAYNPDWLPRKRGEVVAMARVWGGVLETKAALWGVPTDKVTSVASLADTAAAAIEAALGVHRSKVITVRCKEAMKALIVDMRFLKRHYFLSPPLTHVDLESLELHRPDTVLSEETVPLVVFTANVRYLAKGILELRIHSLVESVPVLGRNGCSLRIYWGVMPHGGATVEAATGPKRELMKRPVSGEELPHSRSTRRKRVIITFDYPDSTKTAWFCLQYEDGHGGKGPWGPLFSATIP